jgi:guanine deaminase
LIIAGTLLLPDTDGERPGVRLARGWLRTEVGRVVEVHQGDPPAMFDLGGDGCLISPGFIDTHMHLPQFDLVGAHGMGLLDWLDRVTFPNEARWADPDYAAAMTERVVDQLMSVGTTSFAAYATVHHEATRRALNGCARRGLRAVVGQVLIDQQAPDTMLRDADQCIAQTESLLNDWPSDPGQRAPGNRVSTAVTPRFAITCSEGLLKAAGDLARKHDACIQTHLAEMRPELDAVAKLHGGPDYTSVYHRAGLLTPRTLLGHCIYLSDDERRLLAQTGSVAAHCPTANSFLRSGTMNRQQLLDAGVTLSLGSDIGGGYERSMIRVARAMIEATLHATPGPTPGGGPTLGGGPTSGGGGCPAPSVSEAWWQATAGNADAMGWPDTGRIQENAEADLVIIRPDIPWQTAHNPLGMVMFAFDDRWVKATVINGEVAYSTTD